MTNVFYIYGVLLWYKKKTNMKKKGKKVDGAGSMYVFSSEIIILKYSTELRFNSCNNRS